MIDRKPPQAVDLERAVLGAAMLEKDLIDDIHNIVNADDFYDPRHGKIFDAMLKLSKENKPIDLLTVSQFLRANNEIENVGGAVYLSQLTSNVGSGAHALHHAAIIRETSARRLLRRQALEIADLSYDEAQDIEDIFTKNYVAAVDVQTKLYGSSIGEDASVTAYRAIDEYYKRVENIGRRGITGIETPLTKLDTITGGWQNSDMIIIASRPSMGKTAFACHSALVAGRAGNKVAFFSLEMTGHQLVNRFMLCLSDIDPDRFRLGELTKEETSYMEGAVGELEKMSITLEDRTLSIDEIHTKCRILKKKDKLDLIIIDYLQLLPARQSKNRNREQEVTEMSRHLKAMAKELNVPVIVLSQLNRSCESRNDKRPMLSDIRESGAIEQDADLVLMLYRDAYYDIEFDENGRSTEGIAEVRCVKNRNGATSYTLFRHDQSFSKIEDLKTSENLF